MPYYTAVDPSQRFCREALTVELYVSLSVFSRTAQSIKCVCACACVCVCVFFLPNELNQVGLGTVSLTRPLGGKVPRANYNEAFRLRRVRVSSVI